MIKKRITISDAEINRGHEVKYTSKNLDFDLLERYLKGASIEQLAALRCISRQSVELSINTTALALKSQAGHTLFKSEVKNIRQEVVLWIAALENYKQQQTRLDPHGTYNYVLSWARALTRNDLASIINDLTEIYDKKYEDFA